VVASFRTNDLATGVVAQIEQLGYPAFFRFNATTGWYGIVAGPFDTVDEARTVQTALARAGFADTRVVQSPPAP
jgi:cell division protein FtsN